jgi:type IV pilus assembly protein PilE
MAGMTLLELMAVVMIIGVIGVIALPSYRQYVMRAQRTDAKSALLRVQTNQERFYLANRRYGTVAELIAANLLGAGALSERGAYVIDMPAADATTFTARATPVAGGAFDMRGDTECLTFSITAQGLRTATGSGTNCW